MTTKEKIRAAALQLFNRDGVENVTTRHIAAQLDMSQGNLHYHYPNKNALISILFEAFTHEIAAAARFDPEALFLPQDVIGSMQDHFAIMARYRFLFQDQAVIFRRLPELRTALTQLFAHQKARFNALIAQYRDAQILRPDISPTQSAHLADQLLFTIVSWLQTGTFISPEGPEPAYFARFLFRQWLPYLTPSAMREWETLL
ncbi:MAG: TetR/AcrR family transcriptional regulator [Bacteroidota bacterium]